MNYDSMNQWAIGGLRFQNLQGYAGAVSRAVARYRCESQMLTDFDLRIEAKYKGNHEFMKQCKLMLGFMRMIVEYRASCYASGVTRTIGSADESIDEARTNTLDSLLDSLDFNSFMREVNRYTELLNATAVLCLPDYGADTVSVEWLAMTELQYSQAIEAPNNLQRCKWVAVRKCLPTDRPEYKDPFGVQWTLFIREENGRVYTYEAVGSDPERAVTYPTVYRREPEWAQRMNSGGLSQYPIVVCTMIDPMHGSVYPDLPHDLLGI